jgi:hypothetical protein
MKKYCIPARTNVIFQYVVNFYKLNFFYVVQFPSPAYSVTSVFVCSGCHEPIGLHLRSKFKLKKKPTCRHPLSQSTYCIYKEYHSVCPLVDIGTHPPPLSPGGGGHTRMRVRGWGNPNFDDWRKSLALCLLCAHYNLQRA